MNTSAPCRPANDAFTLVEVVVASALLLTIVFGAISMFFVLQNTWFSATLTMNAATKVSNALNGIVYGGGSTNAGIRGAEQSVVAVNQGTGGRWEFYMKGTNAGEFVAFDPVSGSITNETGHVFCENVVTSTAALANGGCAISVTARETGGRRQVDSTMNTYVRFRN